MALGKKHHAIGLDIDGGGENENGAVFDHELDEGVFIENVVGHKGELIDDDDIATKSARAGPAMVGMVLKRRGWVR